MSKLRNCLGALLLAALVLVVHAENLKLEILPLRHRLIEDVLPVLQPMVAPGGTISGMNNQIIVRTTDANLEELKQVLARIDQAARRLKIYVRQDLAGSEESLEHGLSGRYRTDDADLSLGRSSRNDGLEIATGGRDGLGYRTYGTRQSSEEGNLHFVQAVEGQPAYIQGGQSVPIPQQTIIYDRYGAVVNDSVQYRDVTTGFYVVPRVNGDQVTLSISPQRQRLSPNGGGVIDSQSMETTVTGRLGEWINLGGINEDYRDSGNVNLTHTRRYGTQTSGIQVKVEEIP